MAESPSAAAPEDAAAARAAEQARIRKERREAKIRAGGSARLNKITGLGGGLQRDTPPVSASTSPAPASTPSNATWAAPSAATNDGYDADPEEVDISQHFYTPQSTRRVPSASGEPGFGDPTNMTEAQLRQMMLGFDRPGAVPSSPAMYPGDVGGAVTDDDPMLALLNQMMSGSGMPGLGGGGTGGTGPAGMTNPFAMATAPAVPDVYASFWRLIHFAVALGLGLYVALWTPFTGTKAEREQTAFEHSVGHVTEQDVFKQYFFWAFATAETVLLTSRFLFDRSRAPPSGVVGIVLGLVPQPFKRYLEVALRYARIFSTVRSDILVCVFVLGLCSYLRSS